MLPRLLFNDTFRACVLVALHKQTEPLAKRDDISLTYFFWEKIVLLNSISMGMRFFPMPVRWLVAATLTLGYKGFIPGYPFQKSSIVGLVRNNRIDGKGARDIVPYGGKEIVKKIDPLNEVLLVASVIALFASGMKISAAASLFYLVVTELRNRTDYISDEVYEKYEKVLDKINKYIYIYSSRLLTNVIRASYNFLPNEVALYMMDRGRCQIDQSLGHQALSPQVLAKIVRSVCRSEGDLPLIVDPNHYQQNPIEHTQYRDTASMDEEQLLEFVQEMYTAVYELLHDKEEMGNFFGATEEKADVCDSPQVVKGRQIEQELGDIAVLYKAHKVLEKLSIIQNHLPTLFLLFRNTSVIGVRTREAIEGEIEEFEQDVLQGKRDNETERGENANRLIALEEKRKNLERKNSKGRSAALLNKDYECIWDDIERQEDKIAEQQKSSQEWLKNVSEKRELLHTKLESEISDKKAVDIIVKQATFALQKIENLLDKCTVPSTLEAARLITKLAKYCTGADIGVASEKFGALAKALDSTKSSKDDTLKNSTFLQLREFRKERAQEYTIDYLQILNESVVDRASGLINSPMLIQNGTKALDRWQDSANNGVYEKREVRRGRVELREPGRLERMVNGVIQYLPSLKLENLMHTANIHYNFADLDSKPVSLLQYISVEGTKAFLRALKVDEVVEGDYMNANTFITFITKRVSTDKGMSARFDNWKVEYKEKLAQYGALDNNYPEIEGRNAVILMLIDFGVLQFDENAGVNREAVKPISWAVRKVIAYTEREREAPLQGHKVIKAVKGIYRAFRAVIVADPASVKKGDAVLALEGKIEDMGMSRALFRALTHKRAPVYQ